MAEELPKIRKHLRSFKFTTLEEDRKRKKEEENKVNCFNFIPRYKSQYDILLKK